MRPSEYDPKFCEIVIEQGKQGKSIVQMALACGACRNSLKSWAAQHPEFMTAFSLAKEYSLQWWESIAQTHMIEEPGAAKLNHGIWSRSMAARFPDEYTEKRQNETTLTGSVAGINVSFVDSASK